MRSARPLRGRLVRSPDLLVCWSGRWLLIKDLSSKTGLRASPKIVELLHCFATPRTLAEAATAVPGYSPESVLAVVEQFVSIGFLLPEDEARRRSSLVKAFRENLAALHYRTASRDIPYLEAPEAIDLHLRRNVASRRRPARFKRQGGAPRVALPAAEIGSADAKALSRTLRARRTVRSFSKQPVSLDTFAALLRGTFGATGTLEDETLGTLTLKTSPSAGALHPIECYALVWNVRGLPKGIYHYDVRGDALSRLKSGDFRKQAVKIAAGQSWVRDAAFLCILTAVFGRTFWKYDSDNAYRVILLDAGHLCQTFCLLATAHGVGPFQTAAMKESFIEELLGLDSAKELPVYLCGGGMPG